MSKDAFLFLAVLLLAFCIYYPIMRLARQDMKERDRQGLSNNTIIILLMLPIAGPILYLLFRRSFRVD